MSDTAKILLAHGIGAAKAGDAEQARFYLEWVLRIDASRQDEIRAWRWLAAITEDPEEKREYLEQILAHDLGHAWARRELAILDGRLNPEEIVDPNALPAPQEEPETVQASRYVCPECGGKMVFSPDGKSLVCLYCSYRQTPEEASAVTKRDFIVGLSRATGHRSPVTMQAFTCQSCGASFLLDPETISLSCPFCNSTYTVDLTESREVIPPAGLIPHTIPEDEATRRLYDWLERHALRDRARVTPPRGVYLPIWTFDVSGEITYRYREYDQQQERYVSHEGSQPVLYDDVTVPACTMLPPALVDETRRFDYDRVLPYDPGYLANWPAELYEIALADASIEARAQIVEHERKRIIAGVGRMENFTLSTHRMHVDAYKLLLVPLWIAQYTYNNKQYDVVINGQTGAVQGERPKRSWKRLLEIFEF